MITVGEISKLIRGQVQGDEKARITGMKAVRYAGEGDITFAVDEDDMSKARDTEASCVITTMKAEDFPKTIIYVKDVKEAVTALFNMMEKMKMPEAGKVHPSAMIDKTAELGRNVAVGPYTVIEKGAKIGDNTTIGANCVIGRDVLIGSEVRVYSGVTLYKELRIGARVIIHSGAVIGADGFGYIPGPDGLLRVPQMGSVVIEDDVEIGANSCIDRGTFTDTVVGRGTKIDNLVQIAHNVKIGRNVVMAGQSGIAGSSTIGDNTMLGGQVGVSDHVNVGKNSKIAAQSGVTKHTGGDNATLFGSPARDYKEWIQQAAFARWMFRNSKKIKALFRERNNLKR